jgi:A/G-specific adenine glycosylase
VDALALTSVRSLRRRILNWYQKNQRDLAWRRTRDPYHIWISEIMLQQTRVAAVIPYYARFLNRFPDFPSLAAANEQDLLAAWAGLGYYSRARNLQKAAQKILEWGKFPNDLANLKALPGVGDYTAAAIASIAFNLPHAVLDGNVIRVLSRLTGESGNVDSLVVRTRLRGVADSIIDPRHPGEFNQALMELGATICLPKQPRCHSCPLTSLCRARESGRQNELPLKSVRAGKKESEIRLLLIENKGKILAWKRPPESRRMAGFWELPEASQVPGARLISRIAGFRHTIVNTYYFFDIFRASVPRAPANFQWFSKEELLNLPLSTAARKALNYAENKPRSEYKDLSKSRRNKKACATYKLLRL